MISGARLHEIVEARCPSRAHLGRSAGWSGLQIGEIDGYRTSSQVLSYPSRAEIVATLPAEISQRFIETGDYPMGERCPLLVLDL